jgi:hypothetical protein
MQQSKDIPACEPVGFCLKWPFFIAGCGNNTFTCVDAAQLPEGI